MLPDNEEPDGFPDTENVIASPSGSVAESVKLDEEPAVNDLLPIELRVGARFACMLR